MGHDFLCRSHPDFHMPADAEIGVGFDGDAYIRRLRDSGADAVAMFAKCHYGHSYYPTRVGAVHPLLRTDMLGEAAAACRAQDFGFVAYYSVFLDTCAIVEHPDWALRAQRTGVDAGFDSGKFRAVCVSSPYLEELLLPQCEEVVRDYHPDELLLDTMSGFNPCYCERCRSGFGDEIPESADDERWLDYVRWYRDQYAGFFARVAAEMHEIDPDVRVAFNWEWCHKRPADPPPHIGNLTGDLISTGTVASSVCRYFAGTGLPFAYMTGRFMHGLGDWTSNTTVSIRHTAAATIAHGGDFWIIDRQLPDGSMEDRAYGMMREVFGFMSERRPWIVGARHVPETAALFPYEHVMGPDLEYFADMRERGRRIEQFEGLNELFMRSARHCTTVNGTTLRRSLDRYRLVILPELEFVDPETVDALRAFVEGGGRLLITQCATEKGANPGLLELAGVRFEGFAELGYGYFGTPEPLRITSRFALVSPLKGAEALCGHIEPLHAGKGGAEFGHGFAPPAGESGRPAIVRNRVGDGQVIYIAAEAFGEYHRNFNPFLGELILEQVDRLLPDPIVKVSTPAQVEMVALGKGGDLIVHLVNHSGREQLAGHWYPVFTYMPEVRDIECRIRLAGRAIDVLSVPSGQKMEWREEDGYAVVRVPSLVIMSSLTVPGYFG